MADGAKIYLLIGPSGSGKNTVVNEVLKNFPLAMARGIWTRPFRPGEIPDSDCVSVEYYLREFMKGNLTAANEFAGNFYGTPKRSFTEPLERGQSVIRIVTCDGADAVLADFPDEEIVTIFLWADEHVLRERLAKRGDSQEAIDRRMEAVDAELSREFDWDHVINAEHTPDDVYIDVAAVLRGEKQTTKAAMIAMLVEGKPMASSPTVTEGKVATSSSVVEIVAPEHRPGHYQLCPCANCQKKYMLCHGSDYMIEVDKRAREAEEPIPHVCDACGKREGQVLLGKIRVCLDCGESIHMAAGL